MTDIQDIEDIEDIKDITSDNKNELFLKELIKYNFTSDKHYNDIYKNIRKDLKICPSKPILRKIYNELILNNKIEHNKSFVKYSLKKRGKSSSGVSVITILTSPDPEYTNINGEKVKQQFTCGQNCAFCPNEPELNITFKITNILDNIIDITTEDDIHLIRVLTYIIKNNIKYNVIDCFNFKKQAFQIKVENSNNLFINDIIIGHKISQPRSYLSTEPAVLRANRNNFNPILQIYDRTNALENMGHIVDKIELLVLGGTWDHYPLQYQNEFIRDIYFGVNTITNKTSKKLSLEEEIKINQTSDRRLIGLTLETRPDCINLRQIRKLRKYNVTRLQIGVQHINNKILLQIERGCTNEDTIYGNYLWKQNGGKIDWHLMPDLPGSSVEIDLDMFKKIFGVYSITELKYNYYKYDLKHPELQADQLKIYPCSTVDWTKIKEWYENGTYKPYSENGVDLIEVIAYVKNNIFPWIRLNRVIRDIPNQNIIAGNKCVNLRQILLDRKDINCQCIRCREVKNNTENIDKAELVIREYNGTNSTEYFISYESPDKKILYGFLRLRINHTNEDLIYNELMYCSFIRELHVYGNLINHNDKTNKSSQHIGFGKKLIKKAEEISLTYDYIDKIAIISGVGVREYYIKQNYYLNKNYMFKDLYKPTNIVLQKIIYLIVIFLIYAIIYL